MLNLFQSDLSQAVHLRDHKRGNQNANVRIVIYADFADPAFQSTHATVSKIIKNFADDVLVVYRHFPQTLKNPYAYAVAQALEAADKQDKFWEMLAQVLAHQNKLSDGMLRQYARAIELDKAQFEDDFSQLDVSRRIEQDMQSARASHVESAPAIFINGVRQTTLSMRFIQELIGSNGDISG